MHLVNASLPAKAWGDIRVLGKPIFKQTRPGYCPIFPNTHALHTVRNFLQVEQDLCRICPVDFWKREPLIRRADTKTS